MRFAHLLVCLSAAIVASSLTLNTRGLPSGFNAAGHYGSPIPPWEGGSYPGWYFGEHCPSGYHNLLCLSGLICDLLHLLGLGFLCPSNRNPPPDSGYHQTFNNLTGATEASDYLTYGLVDTVAACEAMCNSVTGCGFVNTYYDVNGKNGSPLLTCALFKICHGAADAINYGGQTQPDGSVDYIKDSNGWCKA